MNQYRIDMLLSKEVAVYLNLAACKLKQYTGNMLRRNNVGLTPEQFLLIDILWNQGPMSQQSLADAMRKDKNSITKIVDGLEKKGLVVRERSTSDRRSNTVVLTHLAQQMKSDAKEKGIFMLDRILDGISEEELRAFLSTLGTMLQNMETDDSGNPFPQPE